MYTKGLVDFEVVLLFFWYKAQLLENGIEFCRFLFLLYNKLLV